MNPLPASLLSDSRLGQHLFHALCAQDRVELPGWGAFVVTLYGADIQLVSGLFLPPARRVVFTPDDSVNGGAFLQQVAHVEGVTLADASRMVHDVVRSWRVRLDQGERILVESIGAFSMRSGFQWVFQPSLEANFLPESYGLPIYRLPVVASQGESRSLRLPVAPHQVSDAPAQRANRVAATATRKELRLPEPTLSAPAAREPAPARIRSNREKWLAPVRSAAVFTGIVGLLVVGGTKPEFQQDLHHVLHEASWMRAPKLTWPSMDLFSQPPYEEPTAATPAKEEAPKSMATPAKEVTDVSSTSVEEPIAKSPVPVSGKVDPSAVSTNASKAVDHSSANKEDHPAAKVDASLAKPSMERQAGSSAVIKENAPKSTEVKKTASQVSGDRYYLVVGAFGDQSNAERMVDHLRTLGHSPQIVPSALGTTKVAAAVANTQSEAYAKRDVLKKSFPAVWVFQGNK